MDSPLELLSSVTLATQTSRPVVTSLLAIDPVHVAANTPETCRRTAPINLGDGCSGHHRSHKQLEETHSKTASSASGHYSSMQELQFQLQSTALLSFSSSNWLQHSNSRQLPQVKAEASDAKNGERGHQAVEKQSAIILQFFSSSIVYFSLLEQLLR